MIFQTLVHFNVILTLAKRFQHSLSQLLVITFISRVTARCDNALLLHVT